MHSNIYVDYIAQMFFDPIKFVDCHLKWWPDYVNVKGLPWNDDPIKSFFFANLNWCRICSNDYVFWDAAKYNVGSGVPFMSGLPLGDYRCTCIQLGLCSVKLLGHWRLDVEMWHFWHGLSPELGILNLGQGCDVEAVVHGRQACDKEKKKQLYFLLNGLLVVANWITIKD